MLSCRHTPLGHTTLHLRSCSEPFFDAISETFEVRSTNPPNPTGLVVVHSFHPHPITWSVSNHLYASSISERLRWHLVATASLTTAPTTGYQSNFVYHIRLLNNVDYRSWHQPEQARHLTELHHEGTLSIGRHLSVSIIVITPLEFLLWSPYTRESFLHHHT